MKFYIEHLKILNVKKGIFCLFRKRKSFVHSLLNVAESYSKEELEFQYKTMKTDKKNLENSSDSFTNSVTTNLRIFSSKLNVVIYINRGKIVLVLKQPYADSCFVIVITQGVSSCNLALE